MNVSPLRALILRKLLRVSHTYQDISERKWVICAGESRTSPPAVYFEEELGRVTSTMEDTNYDFEISRIRGGRSEHGATVAYQIKDIELIDGVLYKGAMMQPLVRRARRHTVHDLDEVGGPFALAGTLYGSIYFGHWMTDDLTLQLAAESLASPLIAERAPYGHEAEYCALVKITQSRIDYARFDRLILLEDAGQNSYKRQRYEELRARLQNSTKPLGNRLVYIRRGTAGANAKRSLVNAAEVESYLRSQGFAVVDPDLQSASDIAAAVSGARLVVGVEGSHIAHALYAISEGGALCVMQPPNRFNNVFKDYADCLDLIYGFTVGTEVTGGFIVHLDDLKRIISKLHTLIEN